MSDIDDKPKIVDHYARAVHASSLVHKTDTTRSNTDVLGAMGLAGKQWVTDASGKRRKGTPLGAALYRLFVGDNRAASTIVEILAEKVISKAHKGGIKLAGVEACDMARAVLAWHRDSRCKPCGGHGKRVIKGTTTLGDELCPVCKGLGRIPFDANFGIERLELARWMAARIEEEQGGAGVEAMRKLAPRLDL